MSHLHAKVLSLAQLLHRQHSKIKQPSVICNKLIAIERSARYLFPIDDGFI